MTKPAILEIKMVPAGVELVLKALNKLPREESHALFEEILGQYMYQIRVLNTPKEPVNAEPVDAEQTAD